MHVINDVTLEHANDTAAAMGLTGLDQERVCLCHARGLNKVWRQLHRAILQNWDMQESTANYYTAWSRNPIPRGCHRCAASIHVQFVSIV